MKKNSIILLSGLVLLLLLTACATNQQTKATAFPKMYEQKPLTVLALPPINTTSSAVAKEYIVCTLAEPVVNKGYYLIPIELSNEILKNEGLYDAETIKPTLYPQLKELFGADALLVTKINKWDTSYYVLGGSVTVGLEYSLISTSTGDVIWTYWGEQKVDTTEQNQGGGLGGLAAALVLTAVNTATTDYIPIARQINDKVFANLPAGKYSPRFGLDGEDPVAK
jgi:hypothetical protein